MSTTPIRFIILIWGDAVDDFLSICLPSLMQPNNIPWLVRNGYAVALDFYTVKRDEPRVSAFASDLHNQIRAIAPPGDAVTATLTVGPDGLSDFDNRSVFFRALAAKLVETRSHGLFAEADRFFGDGSIRHIVTYGEKPGVTVSGLMLDVERERFRERVARHVAVAVGKPVTNPRLVDIALDSLTPAMRAAFADDEHNASYVSSGTFRHVSDDLSTYTLHAPLPMLFFFEDEDLEFFERFLWNMALFEHVWPSMLIAKNRWRMMASSDLFCVARVVLGASGDASADAAQPGMQYNDEYDQEHLHGRIHQTMLIALRRERLAT